MGQSYCDGWKITDGLSISFPVTSGLCVVHHLRAHNTFAWPRTCWTTCEIKEMDIGNTLLWINKRVQKLNEFCTYIWKSESTPFSAWGRINWNLQTALFILLCCFSSFLYQVCFGIEDELTWKYGSNENACRKMMFSNCSL